MTLTLPSPTRHDPALSPALRWGVVGTGVADAFVGALHAHTGQRAVAVTARDADRTAAFAARHGIDRVHGSVEALCADPQVDAVYVSTPHPLHHRHALTAVAHGKHVLVEKPLAMSAAEAREVLQAARAAGVLAMEAMWTRYLPQSDVLRQVLADGMLGEVHLVVADFGFPAPDDPAHRLWNPALGGGALLDAGVYPVSFAESVLGPLDLVSAVGRARAGGVDERAHLQLSSASGAVAQVSTSLVTSLPTQAAVAGSQGVARLAAPFFTPTTLEVTVGAWAGAASARFVDDRFATPHEGMCDEAQAFARYVGEGRLESPVHDHASTVAVLEVLDAARAAVADGTV